MSNIRIEKTVHIEQKEITEEAMVASMGYISGTSNTLMQAVWYGGQRDHYFRIHPEMDTDFLPETKIFRSDDDGKTWQKVEDFPFVKNIHGRLRMTCFSPNWLYHPVTGRIVRIYLSFMGFKGVLPWDEESISPNTQQLWIEYSDDGGDTWSVPEPFVATGKEYNHKHWGPGLFFGVNGAHIEGVNQVALSGNSFILASPLAGKDAVLRGSWLDDGGITWTFLPHNNLIFPDRVSDDAEPSIARLQDGRIMMTHRVRFKDDAECLAGKYFSLSDDQGKNWSRPEPMQWDDGTLVYGPACLTNIFRARKTGKLYIISNFTEHPTGTCDPRHVLQIGVINEDTLKIERESLTTIEERKPEQPENIRFSNFRWYESRSTGNIILYMTACPGDVGRYEDCGVPPHSYRYEITLS